ncbi:jg1305 [Pararge aegeria aegeria]|uniref:Jg1305 protein n=1 Tax=Pararge aegeria aegeria TaxID=348720 RepID=A0A8S4R7D8_9NEOP|nr:jg1305 [Pararge aegeria aegeria]
MWDVVSVYYARVACVRRSIRGAMSAGPLSVRPKPTFLSDRALNGMVLEAAKDCFVMVVSCSRGRLLYVSASVTNMLQYDKVRALATRNTAYFAVLMPVFTKPRQRLNRAFNDFDALSKKLFTDS